MGLATHINSVQHLEDMWGLQEANNFKAVCRSNISRRGTVHDKEQEVTNDNQTDMVSINSIHFNSKQLAIVGKIKNLIRSKKYNNNLQINSGSAGNIMPIHKFKFHFLGWQKNIWWHENNKLISKTIQKIITQLGICGVNVRTILNKRHVNSLRSRKWSSFARNASHRKP